MMDSGEIQNGTVGWDGEEAVEDVEAGSVTLVRVTLFDGRDRGSELREHQLAQGRRVVARISAPSHYIPKRGSEVYLARPAGTDSWCIIGNPSPSSDQFKGGTRAVVDYGPDTDVIIKGRSLTWSTYDDDHVTLSPEAGYQVMVGGSGAKLKDDKWVLFVVDGDDDVVRTCLQVSPDMARILSKTSNTASASVSALTVGKSSVEAVARNFTAKSGSVVLGASATAANTALVGPSGLAAVPSTSVRIQV